MVILCPTAYAFIVNFSDDLYKNCVVELLHSHKANQILSKVLQSMHLKELELQNVFTIKSLQIYVLQESQRAWLVLGVDSEFVDQNRAELEK